MTQEQTVQTGYISSTSGDIRDASIFLTKSLFILANYNAELQASIWFPRPKSIDQHNLFLGTCRAFYFVYTYTMSHFRDTKKHKLSLENLEEIKTTLEETDNFFKRLNKINWSVNNKNDLTSMIRDIDILINAYLNSLNMIGLHKIGLSHEFLNPEMAYAGTGAI